MSARAPAWLERWPVAYVHPHRPWTVTDGRRWGVVVPETGTVDEVDPAEDPRLPGLGPALRQGRLICYRYGRRAVIAAPSSYIKVVRPQRASGLADIVEAVALTASGFSVASVESVSDDGRIKISIVAGTALHQRLRDAVPARLDSVARLVAAFHQAQEPRHFEVRTPDAPERWVRIVARAEPQLTRELAAAAADLPVLEPRSETVVHGDLHDKNILLSESQFGLIDFDAMGRGAVEDDVANLGVHVELRGMQAGRKPSAGRRDALDLYRAYDEQRALDWSRIDAVERHTWFRLACLYRFRRTSRQLSSAMLTRSMGAASRARRSQVSSWPTEGAFRLHR